MKISSIDTNHGLLKILKAIEGQQLELQGEGLEAARKASKFAVDVFACKQQAPLYLKIWYRIRYTKRFNATIDTVCEMIKSCKLDDQQEEYEISKRVEKLKKNHDVLAATELKAYLEGLRLIQQKTVPIPKPITSRVVLRAEPEKQVVTVQDTGQVRVIERLKQEKRRLIHELKSQKSQVTRETEINEEHSDTLAKVRAENRRLLARIKRLDKNIVQYKEYEQDLLEETDRLAQIGMHRGEKRRLQQERDELKTTLHAEETLHKKMDALVASYTRRSGTRPLAFSIIDEFREWLATNPKYQLAGEVLLENLKAPGAIEHLSLSLEEALKRALPLEVYQTTLQQMISACQNA